MKKRSSNEDSLASEAASKTEGKGSSAEDESSTSVQSAKSIDCGYLMPCDGRSKPLEEEMESKLVEVRSKPLSIVEFKPVEKEGRSKLLDEEGGSRPLHEDDEVRSKPVEEIASKPEPDKYQPEFVPVRCKPKSYPSILTPQESSANDLTKGCTRILNHHDMYIHSFDPSYPEMTVVVILPESCLIGDAKYRIAETMGLKMESVYLFALFEYINGQEYQPIPDHTPVKYYKNVAFRRFSFDSVLETELSKRDDACMDLIYYESIFALERDLLFPYIKNENEIVYSARSEESTESISARRVLLQRLRCHKLSFWSFYYKIDNCMLCSQTLPSNPFRCERDFVHVSFDLKYLILLNENGDELNLFEWTQIHSVWLYPSRMVKFKVAQGFARESKLESISLEQNKYYDCIFSISVHLIKFNESLSDRRTSFKHEPELVGKSLVYFNDSFLDQGSLPRAPTQKEHLLRVTKHEALEATAYGVFDVQEERSGATPLWCV